MFGPGAKAGPGFDAADHQPADVLPGDEAAVATRPPPPGSSESFPFLRPSGG